MSIISQLFLNNGNANTFEWDQKFIMAGHLACQPPRMEREQKREKNRHTYNKINAKSSNKINPFIKYVTFTHEPNENGIESYC